MQRLVWLICLGFWFFPSLSSAKPLTPEQVPEPLKPWIAWVSEADPERVCPFLYSDDGQKRCVWPTAATLELAGQKGLFTGAWQVYKDAWVGLPGDAGHWPQNVTVNGQVALVMDRGGVPSIKLLAGKQPPSGYQVKGEFVWERLPDNLSVPVDTGLIKLSINGMAIAAPTIRDGQLWLKESESGQKKPDNVQNSLDVQVFRQLLDDVPMQVVTRLVLDVAGGQREVKLAKPLLDGFIPLALVSALPARLEADGQLLVQVRPGHWQIDITARSVNEAKTLALATQATQWPQSEIWLFQARPELRVVEVEGVPAIDTSQSNVPEEWKSLPAYSVNNGQAMGFKVIRRGDPEPDANQLRLERTLWLDFDGGGYTANDRVTGKLSRGWRLAASAHMQLGRVSLDEENLLITRLAGSDKQGVEVRQGELHLQADSRIVGGIGGLSAVGWEQDFQQVNAELNLPPGWRLLAATGVDNDPDSWVARWTLLDWFMVFCAAGAVAMLWRRYWGGVALLALVLIWHEPDAPHFVWLHILAATGLLRQLPVDKFLSFRRWVQGYRLLAWLALLLMALPFMVAQVHNGFYPQLETPIQNYVRSGAAEKQVALPAAASVNAPMADDVAGADGFGVASGKVKRALLKSMPMSPVPYGVYEQASSDSLARIDPTAKVQTGPGLPQWHWHKVRLSWNGAVSSEQRVSLWYVSPTLTLWLNLLRVGLVVVLAVLMWGGMERSWPKWPRFRTVSPLWLGLLVLPVLLAMAPRSYADYPSEALLGELKARLQAVEPPDCLPGCADIAEMTVNLNDQVMEISLQIHASASVVLPLPADYGQWFPHEVLDNGAVSAELYRENNGLFIHLAAGAHRVVLKGAPPLLSQFTLPLPLKPKLGVYGKNSLETPSWEVVGIQADGVLDDQLQFSRIGPHRNANNAVVLEPGTLPAFIRVERTLQLGLDWRVDTRVIRLSPPGSAVALNVGLLPGEAVGTAGIHVKDGAVQVNMSAQDLEMSWQSTLEKAPVLTLLAPVTEQWTEVWKVNVSPIWHLETSGIAPIHSLNLSQWLPEWQPWPGEKISLQITRPEAVNGQTLTIDHSQLNIKLGQRLRDIALSFSLRSSQGGQHTVALPEHAVLQAVAINGQSLPIRLQGRKLTLPVVPGKQEVSVNWQENQPISTLVSTPSVDLGLPSVNSHLAIGLGEERWVLWVGGPTLGPVVLFWGVLPVILLVSLALGKVSLTPLRHWQWFLLLIGLSQVPMVIAGIVIAWLMLLGWRQTRSAKARYFNELQVLLALVTVLSLGVLFAAVAQGLLSTPDMRVTGNNSNAFNLYWYQDRSSVQLPIATVMSVPVLVYRLLMLGWSLWLAVSLLAWLKWGWACFASNGLWQKPPFAKVAEPVIDDGND